MVRVLFERYRYHVKYQCSVVGCAWGGMVALGWVLTPAECLQWFACPAHGDDQTSDPYKATPVYLMDRDQTRARAK